MISSELSKLNRIILLWSAGVSLFWVLFLWGFWMHGIFAFGMNAFVFLAATMALFFWMMRHRGLDIKINLFWIVPLGLVAASFLIYDNPFLKTVSLLLFPVLFAGFCNYAYLEEKAKVHWNATFLMSLFFRCLSFLGSIGQSAALYAGGLMGAKSKNSPGRRIVIGIVLFLVIAFTVIIPLLSSADAAFAAQVRVMREWVRAVIATSVVSKALFGFVLSVAIVAAALAWSRPFAFEGKQESEKKIDPIISGIVLGGTLALYLLFLAIQFRQLVAGSLPFEFKDVVHLVKSGFWQLLFLTLINIAIFFITYRKTAPAVQNILGAFTVASLLLLASAAHRMARYVVNYGFSYEKFFASYAVLFCAVLIVWLLSRFFARKPADILKFAIILFLWMYAVLTVAPVEQIVLRSNVALAQRPGSHIRLYELTMLSPDVLGLVKRFQSEGRLEQITLVPATVSPASEIDDWRSWIADREKTVAEKKWYEKNIMNIVSR